VDSLASARQAYAEELRQIAAVRSEAVVRAFASVPRERFVGPGPWSIFVGDGYRATPDDDPRQLYRDVLIGIDVPRWLNNGQPSAHARWIDALDPREGDCVVHVGSGTGYYTAVLAEAVGTSGRVLALELDEALAERARRNLEPYPRVEVRCADGCTHDPGPVDAIYVNAGATHLVPLWLDRLRSGGRLLVPLVRWPVRRADASLSGYGVMLCIARAAAGDRARIVSVAGFFPCIGAVDAEADRRLGECFARGVRIGKEYAVRRDAHPPTAACWLHGDAACLWSEPADDD
jgi:protein-L-isoaspartate(D-aspartate) O-methyltransferase